jgi:hypothetical protein
MIEPPQWFVMVMQATDLRDLYDLSQAGRLQRARLRAIRLLGQMPPPAVIPADLLRVT